MEDFKLIVKTALGTSFEISLADGADTQISEVRAKAAEHVEGKDPRLVFLRESEGEEEKPTLVSMKDEETVNKETGEVKIQTLADYQVASGTEIYIFVSKARGHYQDHTPERRKEIEDLCKSKTFTDAPMIAPPEIVRDFLEGMKGQLPPGIDVDLDGLTEKFCSMENIIAHDQKTVERLGTTTEQLGDALKTVARLAVHKADTHFGGALVYAMAQIMGGEAPKPPEFKSQIQGNVRGRQEWCDQGRFESEFEFNGQHLLVFVILWGGSQRCPFQHPLDQSYHGYDYGARDVVVTNLDNGEVLRFSTLLPHMIKHRGFFEGPFCWYRVEPEQIIKVLGPMEPGKSYKIQSHMEMKMRSTGSSGTHSHRDVKDLGNDVECVMLRHHNVYLNGDKLLIDPVDNTDSVTEQDHAAGLKKLGIEADDVREGWHKTLSMQNTKVYHWSDWIPEKEDGNNSTLAQEASGPSIMMLGKK